MGKLKNFKTNNCFELKPKISIELNLKFENNDIWVYFQIANK